MPKIYTRTGDTGETSIFLGERVFKSEHIFEVLGNIDELNSVLGLTYASNESFKKINKIIISIQRELFSVGAILASTKDKGAAKEIPVYEGKVKALEEQIDNIDKKLPLLKNFILPSGDTKAVYFHIARAICRRAERSLVREVAKNKRNELKPIIKYMNRLSDLLFTLARYTNKLSRKKEIVWAKAAR